MPASRSSTGYPGRRLERNDEIPPPGAAIMAVLSAEGIAWQGQVAVIGQEEVPARLIVTSERFLLMRGSDTLLELPRPWLVPAPLVIDGADVRVSITPDGTVPSREATERIQLRLRDGREAATRLVSILSGRGALFAETPGWRSDVGAGRANALPTLPAFETRQDAASGRPAADADADPEIRGVAPIATWSGGQTRRVTPPAMRASEPAPVEATSRAGRFLTYRPVEADDAPVASSVAAAPTSIDEERERRRGGGWLAFGSCVAVLALVLAAGWFGREYLPAPVTERLPAFVLDARDTNTDTVTIGADDVAGNTIDANREGTDGTGGAESDPVDIMPTEVALGLGGQVPNATEQPTGNESVPAPNSDVAPPAGNAADDTGSEDVADEGDGDEGEQEPPVAAAPTETAASEPTTAPEAAPVEATEPASAPGEATETATESAVVTETPVETAIATETIPPRATATVEPTVAPTATVEPTPTLEPQAPSVDPNAPPAQAFAAEGFRYSIAGADSGSTLEDLPEIAEVGYGEWVVLTVDGQNWTDAEQVFDMAQFVLIADGEPVLMDVGTSWVASQLDLMPAYGNTDAILWAPGESHTFALTFLAPVGAQSLVLQAGDQRFDLTPVLERDTGLVSQPQGPAPEAIEAPVVEVIDGETIVVDIDGVRQTVRYLGIDVPDTDECHGTESTDANRALVEGAVVRIERQATNVDAQGNWVRDVWVASDEGAWELAAHRLVRDGAATAAISEPNTRFASWLGGADAAARAEGLGLWATCGA